MGHNVLFLLLCDNIYACSFGDEFFNMFFNRIILRQWFSIYFQRGPEKTFRRTKRPGRIKILQSIPRLNNVKRRHLGSLISITYYWPNSSISASRTDFHSRAGFGSGPPIQNPCPHAITRYKCWNEEINDYCIFGYYGMNLHIHSYANLVLNKLTFNKILQRILVSLSLPLSNRHRGSGRSDNDANTTVYCLPYHALKHMY